MKKTKVAGIKKTQVIGIVENNLITGVKYGLIDTNQTVFAVEQAKTAYVSAVAKVQSNRTKQMRGERTKNK